jgi:hypothetical protein
MKTTGQHISNLRGLIKNYSRTPEPYTDQFLYEVLCISRAEILKQKLDKFNHLSEENLIRFCMELELIKAHDCNCVPTAIDCLVLRSKYKLPTAITSRNKSRMYIATLDGKEINIMSEKKWRLISDNDVFGELTGSLVNGYLYIWNLNKKIKVLQVAGYWSDLSYLQTIPNCDPNTPTLTCYDPLATPFPLQDEYAQAVYRRSIELLNIPMQAQQDLTNDSNELIKV